MSNSDIVPVEVEAATEPWSEYRLADGATLRVKNVLIEVRRHVDRYTPDGDPLYEVKMAPVISTRAPEALRKKE